MIADFILDCQPNTAGILRFLIFKFSNFWNFLNYKFKNFEIFKIFKILNSISNFKVLKFRTSKIWVIWVTKSKWLRILSLGGNGKTRNHLVANTSSSFTFHFVISFRLNLKKSKLQIVIIRKIAKSWEQMEKIDLLSGEYSGHTSIRLVVSGREKRRWVDKKREKGGEICAAMSICLSLFFRFSRPAITKQRFARHGQTTRRN